MKLLIAISVTLTMFAGCTTTASVRGPLPQLANCTEPGHIQINIHYVKDSEIKVTGAAAASPHKPKVTPGKAIRFMLIGDDSVKVTVWGKTVKSQWILGTGTKSRGNNYFEICVPDNTEDDEDYHYFVNVQGIGTLDPVVRVVKGI